jgi:hypothetical protein
LSPANRVNKITESRYLLLPGTPAVSKRRKIFFQRPLLLKFVISLYAGKVKKWKGLFL